MPKKIPKKDSVRIFIKHARTHTNTLNEIIKTDLQLAQTKVNHVLEEEEKTDNQEIYLLVV